MTRLVAITVCFVFGCAAVFGACGADNDQAEQMVVKSEGQGINDCRPATVYAQLVAFLGYVEEEDRGKALRYIAPDHEVRWFVITDSTTSGEEKSEVRTPSDAYEVLADLRRGDERIDVLAAATGPNPHFLSEGGQLLVPRLSWLLVPTSVPGRSELTAKREDSMFGPCRLRPRSESKKYVAISLW